MKDVTVLDGKLDLYSFDDVLASQYQSSDWTQHITNQSSICWGNLLAPGSMYKVDQKLENRVIGLRSTGVHSLVRLPKACW